MFDQLLAMPGVEEICELRSPFGFMAYHGGSLEEMTDVIATAAAHGAGTSLYAVRQPPDLRWHIPSTSVRPEHSHLLAGFLEHVEVVITVHGYGREGFWTTLLAGGGNRLLAEHVAAHLRPALPEYRILTDIDEIPVKLRGLHPHNPVNRPPRQGVQLELPPRVRGRSPIWKQFHTERPGALVPHTQALIDGLIAAARSWPTDG